MARDSSQHGRLSVSYLLPFSVQAEQADKAADLQQEINKNSQASKERERPHCWHVGQGSCRRHTPQLSQHALLQGRRATFFRCFINPGYWLITTLNAYLKKIHMHLTGCGGKKGDWFYPGRRPQFQRRQRGKCSEPRRLEPVQSGHEAPHWAFAHLAENNHRERNTHT